VRWIGGLLRGGRSKKVQVGLDMYLFIVCRVRTPGNVFPAHELALLGYFMPFHPVTEYKKVYLREREK
jgi:hypothetical protein